jgi:hypothetical protein
MRISGLIGGVLIAGFAVLCSSQVAQARPEYNKHFWEMYKKEIGAQADAVKCNACHFGDVKKNRNDYGKAMHKALGEDQKQVKDADKIKAALEKTAKEKSGTDGKTFGDLIKDGKLPGKNP